jgi:hypothetical protein
MSREEALQELIEKSEEVEINKGNEVDYIMRYESDELEDYEIIALFQYLINNGMAWQLQGHYGRMASNLIEQGICHKKIS